MRRVFLLLFLFLAPGLLAQTYPDRTDPHVIDLADMLSDQEEATLRTQLERLLAEDETEMAIVTLPSVAEQAGTLTEEEYARDLFQVWGLGDGTRNDGVLMILFRDDRSLRVELGLGYDGQWTGLLAGIIQYRILPLLGDGNLPGGLSVGIDLIRDMIVRPFRAGQPAPEPISAPDPAPAATGEGGGSGTILGVIGAVVAAIAGLVIFGRRRRAARLGALVCGQCGHKGLTERVEVARQPTETVEGERRTITTCPACGHETVKVAAIPVRSADDDRPKTPPPGGKAGGGGAGGTW